MAEALRTVELGNSGIKASVIGYGTYHLGDKLDEFSALLSMGHAFDRGVTLFDTSDNYGTEGLIGIAVREGYLPRDEVVIATKTGLGTSYAHQVALRRAKRKGDTSPNRIRQQVDKSLAVLGKDVGVIDLYQLHTYDDTVPPAEQAAVMQELIDAGKIRSWGVSNYPIPALTRLIDACDAEGVVHPVTTQPFLNVVSGAGEVGFNAATKGMTVLAHSPLLKGMLTGSAVDKMTAHVRAEAADISDEERAGYDAFKKGLEALTELRNYAQMRGLTLAQFAISWAANRPNTVVLTACTNEQYLDDAITGAAHTLDTTDPKVLGIQRTFRELPFAAQSLALMRDMKYYYR